MVKEAGGEAFVSVDNTVEQEEANRLMAAAAERFGKIDVVVNNAGITRDRMFHTLDEDTWDLVLSVNLQTAYHTTRAAVPYLRDAAKKEMAEGGRPAYHRKITFTTSSAALTGNSGQANYTAAKGAIIGLTRCVRPPLPCRPSKLRLLVEAHRSPGCKISGFIPRHIEHPDSRHSNPASRKILSSPSCSASRFTACEPGTTMARTFGFTR